MEDSYGQESVKRWSYILLRLVFETKVNSWILIQVHVYGSIKDKGHVYFSDINAIFEFKMNL